MPLWQGIAAGCSLAAVTLMVLYQATKRPFLVTGWFWFIGMLIPVIGIIQVGMQSLADRYTYLSFDWRFHHDWLDYVRNRKTIPSPETLVRLQFNSGPHRPIYNNLDANRILERH